MKILKMLMFDCARKHNRDNYGWWKVETGLVILMWLFIFQILLTVTEAHALEKDYQIPWCQSQGGSWTGKSVTIRDQFTNKVEGYVDCLTATHAIEVDFDYKWMEAKTQAEWYAMHTGKRAGVLLIITRNKNGKQNSGEKKLRDLINHQGAAVDVWTVQK